MKRYQKSMLQGPLFLNIITYTIPIILTSLLQLLFNAADLVIVGRFCGSIYVAAVGATGAITNLVVNLFIGLSVGAAVCMSHALGSRDHEMAHRTVHTAMPMALVSGVFLTIVGVTFSGTFLTWMGTPEDVLPLSATYMRLYFCGMTFNMVYNFCAAILRAAGDTKGPLIYLTIAGVVNVVLNIFFVTVFHMNVAGVALATAISQGVSAVLVVIALMRRTDGCKLHLQKIRFYKAQLMKMLAKGLPAGIQSSMFSISNVLIQSSINSFGDVMMSACAAASNIEGFGLVSMNAFHQTALNFVGQNVGAGQYDRVKKIAGACLLCVTAVGITICGGMFLAAPQLLSIYITDSPEAIILGARRMAFVMLPYFVYGLQDVTTGLLRGLGASLAPMLISVAGICGLRILWISTVFQTPQFHTPDWLFVSYPISWLVTFIAQFALFTVIYRKQATAYKKSVGEA